MFDGPEPNDVAVTGSLQNIDIGFVTITIGDITMQGRSYGVLSVGLTVDIGLDIETTAITGFRGLNSIDQLEGFAVSFSAGVVNGITTHQPLDPLNPFDPFSVPSFQTEEVGTKFGVEGNLTYTHVQQIANPATRQSLDWSHTSVRDDDPRGMFSDLHGATDRGLTQGTGSRSGVDLGYADDPRGIDQRGLDGQQGNGGGVNPTTATSASNLSPSMPTTTVDHHDPNDPRGYQQTGYQKADDLSYAVARASTWAPKGLFNQNFTAPMMIAPEIAAALADAAPAKTSYHEGLGSYGNTVAGQVQAAVQAAPTPWIWQILQPTLSRTLVLVHFDQCAQSCSTLEKSRQCQRRRGGSSLADQSPSMHVSALQL